MDWRKQLTVGILTAVILTACSAKPESAEEPAQDTAGTSVLSSEKEKEGDTAEEKAGLPKKLIPGCRVDLPYPLQMNGDSDATAFSSDWTAMDIHGNTVSQDILKGSKVTVVSAWSTYCGSCLDDLAILQRIYSEYDRGEVNVIGIVVSSQNLDGSPKEGEIETARQFSEMVGAEFLQLLPSDDLIAIKLHEIDIVPETFLLDQNGNLIGESQIGARTEEELKQLIKDGLSSLSQAE